MAWLFDYSLFLVKSITVVLAIGAILLLLIMARKKTNESIGELSVKDISKQYHRIRDKMKTVMMDDKSLKGYYKTLKKNEKLKQAEKNNSYILEFKGNVQASEVDSLREEITAILSQATDKDEVILKLESPGGVVHGYGLAASQLMRLKKKNIPLTIVVDKVAASGGYMMACTANKIIAAPFAIIGSIGVVAQIPNFHRLLKKNEIDIELQTAGKYKRTLTMLGENTDEGRTKFKEELEETHYLFKSFIKDNRPELAIDEVATGEYWYGTQALEKGLIDEISTSDDVILSRLDKRHLIAVSYQKKQSKLDKLVKKSQLFVETLFFRNGKTL